MLKSRAKSGSGHGLPRMRLSRLRPCMTCTHAQQEMLERRHLTPAIFRYEDRPGMLGRIGTAFGDKGVNIRSAAVGLGKEEDTPEGTSGQAVMLIVSDAVSQDLVDELVATEGFVAGRAVSL